MNLRSDFKLSIVSSIDRELILLTSSLCEHIRCFFLALKSAAILSKKIFIVASQTAMLALSAAQEGDVAVRTDLSKSFILKASPYSTLANWQELLSPTDAVTSVNGSTGAVSITLAGLGGVASSTFNSHVSSNLHLTETQRNVIANILNSRVVSGAGSDFSLSQAAFGAAVIGSGLKIYQVIDSNYTPHMIKYSIGIDSSKVLQPTSIIDGGTY